MHTVQSFAESLFEINPDLPIVVRDNKGNELKGISVTVEDDKVVLTPYETEGDE